jgi:hypothetical protein
MVSVPSFVMPLDLIRSIDLTAHTHDDPDHY